MPGTLSVSFSKVRIHHHPCGKTQWLLWMVSSSLGDRDRRKKGKLYRRRNRAALKKVVGILEKLLAFKRDV